MHPNLITVIDTLFEAMPKINMELFKDAGGLITVRIPIGSKSGTGVLYELDNKIWLKTRYDRNDIIRLDSIMEDISDVAWDWYLNYKELGLSSEWLPIWIKEGKIEEKVVTKTEYVIK